MSWSVSASGLPADVKTELAKQFTHPLADKPSGLADDGERQTVTQISAVINQCLDTFDPAKGVAVSANGHISFDDWDVKSGSRQNVSLSIQPL